MNFLDISHFIANFFEGAFICNCIPHLTSGLRGEQFPTPFAKPRGVGKGSAVVNFLWGTLNFMIAMLLISYFPVRVGLNVEGALFMAGFILLGMCLARYFERVKANKIDWQAKL
jgi:hypothetical protein